MAKNMQQILREYEGEIQKRLSLVDPTRQDSMYNFQVTLNALTDLAEKVNSIKQSEEQKANKDSLELLSFSVALHYQALEKIYDLIKAVRGLQQKTGSGTDI